MNLERVQKRKLTIICPDHNYTEELTGMGEALFHDIVGGKDHHLRTLFPQYIALNTT